MAPAQRGLSLEQLARGDARKDSAKSFANGATRRACRIALHMACASRRRFAKVGCSNQQIKAWTGHTTGSEASRYTAAADQQSLSDSAGEMLMANLRKGLVVDDANVMKARG